MIGANHRHIIVPNKLSLSGSWRELQPQMLWPHGFFRMEPDMRERVMSGLLLADSLKFTYDLEELQQAGTNPHHEVL